MIKKTFWYLFMTNFYIPPNYHSSLSVLDTQIAIYTLKQNFAKSFSRKLSLTHVEAPLFVSENSGLNDTLNGIELPVSFHTNELSLQIVHSLAKWKRLALKNYGFSNGEGLYTNMRALRTHETPDNTHSILVDQWDWEQIISPSERNLQKLEKTVNLIYSAIKETEYFMIAKYPMLSEILPPKITFINSTDLESLYPNCCAKTKEYLFAKKYGAIFIEQIGGSHHENRAPDYDDWTLNGDLIFYYPLLDTALEISSMGIRVDKTSLLRQLKESDCEHYVKQYFHQMLLNENLPLTIGGGIGQSRLCMFLLQKAHIGEVQPSIWPEEILNTALYNEIFFL